MTRSVLAHHEQAKRERHCLGIVEHQRREFVATPQVIRAVWPVFRLDGYPHVLQHHDVAPHRASVYFEPPREFCAAHLLVRLQQFQNREQPGRRRIHREISPND
jgi:isocitrate dehydrogenase kinase/phosphatase